MMNTSIFIVNDQKIEISNINYEDGCFLITTKEPKYTINISLKEVNNNIELLVKNMGDEIPRGEESKIFERFYRGDKSRNRDNNRYGLGLAIAKNIVDNHNGEIGASSSDGVTTFKVLFKK